MATSKPDMSIIWSAAGSNVKPSDAKIQEGWIAEKPPFQTENWIQERQDQFLKHIDERGIPEWDNKSEYLINSLVWYNNLIWNSLTTPNIGNVPADGLGFWKSQANVDKRGDQMLGELHFLEGVDLDYVTTNPPSGLMRVNIASVKRLDLGLGQSGQFFAQVYGPTGLNVNNLSLATNGDFIHLGREVWDSGNDGPGSGLNADLLDGFHATDFFNAVRGRDDWDAQGTWQFTVPANVNVIFASLVGNGQGGEGGGDGGTCGAGGTPAAGNSVTVSGALGILTAGGGNSNIGVTLTTPIGQAYALSSHSSVMSADGGGANPVRGGHGADSIYGAGGIGTAAFGGPLSGWNGIKGGGGAGGGGQDGLGGRGGAAGFGSVGVPFPVNPGEVVTIVIPARGAGTTGCRSTGGWGGFGYVILEW